MLFDRLTGLAEPKIAVHDFGSAVHLWLLGDINDQRMIVEFELSQGEQTEMIAIRNKYNSLSATLKSAFLLKTHSVFVLCESGRMSEAEAKAVLGF